MTYDTYRTGLTFRDVRQMLRVEAQHVFEREGRRMFVTRRTVLGRWHQIKRESYAATKRELQREQREARRAGRPGVHV